MITCKDTGTVGLTACILPYASVHQATIDASPQTDSITLVDAEIVLSGSGFSKLRTYQGNLAIAANVNTHGNKFARFSLTSALNNKMIVWSGSNMSFYPNETEEVSTEVTFNNAGSNELIIVASCAFQICTQVPTKNATISEYSEIIKPYNAEIVLCARSVDVPDPFPLSPGLADIGHAFWQLSASTQGYNFIGDTVDENENLLTVMREPSGYYPNFNKINFERFPGIDIDAPGVFTLPDTSSYTHRKSKKVSISQLEAATQMAYSIKITKPQYSLVSNNCVDNAIKVAAAAGISINAKEQLTVTLTPGSGYYGVISVSTPRKFKNAFNSIQ